jgi:hypothetical protein
MLDTIDSDLHNTVRDTGCFSLKTLKMLDAKKTMRYNFSVVYLHARSSR